jgi:hypothetical protein
MGKSFQPASIKEWVFSFTITKEVVIFKDKSYTAILPYWAMKNSI